MEADEIIRNADIDSLSIVKYPDPRLKVVCEDITEVNGKVRLVAAKMVEMMFANQGVGLAGPQVGLTIRLFVTTPSFSKDDVQVYINPKIISEDGWQEDDEGCLSLPGISCNVKRRKQITIEALDLDGKKLTATLEDFPARVFQHELDHLNGKTLINRMSAIAKISNRKAIKQLETQML